MDIKQYLPIGEENAIRATVILVGGGTVTGDAWLDSQSTTDVSVKGTSITGVPTKWIIGSEQIAALGMEQPAANREGA